MTTATVRRIAPEFRSYPDRESWLAARKLGIGSSDAAALVGESNFSSPLQLNYLKRNLIDEQRTAEEMEALDWHRERETEIARWWWSRQVPKAGDLRLYQELGDESVELADPGDFAVAWRTVEGLPLFATFDRVLRMDDRMLAPVELKNVSAWMNAEWVEEPPLIYQLQVQHQILVAGTDYAYLVASIGGQPPKWAEVVADHGVHEILIATYRRFWSSVVRGEDLPADYREVTSRAIAQRYPRNDGTVVDLVAGSEGLWEERCRRHEDGKAAAERKDELTNELKQRIGAASYGKLMDGRVLSLIADRAGRRNLKEVKGEHD